MWFAFIYCFALIYFSVGATPQKDSSVWIAVDTDVSNKQMTRIDLVETFHPLSSASAIKTRDAIKGKMPPRIRAPSPRLTEHSSVQQLRELELADKPHSSSFPIAAESTVGWQQWGSWSSCFHFERIRVRSCRPSMVIQCIGDRTEKQLCLRSGETNTLVAKDPWVVEREINRSYLNDKVNSTSKPKK